MATTQQTDKLIEQKIARYLELKAQQSEYNRLQKELKDLFKNTPYIVIGDYTITGSLVSREGYKVEPFTYWDMKINVTEK